MKCLNSTWLPRLARRPQLVSVARRQKHAPPTNRKPTSSFQGNGSTLQLTSGQAVPVRRPISPVSEVMSNCSLVFKSRGMRGNFLLNDVPDLALSWQLLGILPPRPSANRDAGSDPYFTTIRLAGAGGGPAAGVIAKVSHRFQPSGRCEASNSL